MKVSDTKNIILAFVKSTDSATYAKMQYELGFCRATLRRWVMELELEGLVTRHQEHSKARAVFSAVSSDKCHTDNMTNDTILTD